jgi:hypothetical protein
MKETKYLATALSLTAIPDIDFLLRAIVADLQLTPTQYQRAVDRYEAVGRYLERPDSPLARLSPRVFPQGSMALQTSIKPIDRLEHDLDLVSQTLPSGHNPIWLYETTYKWLSANAQYQPILERYKRCIRLNYAGDFHLDVVPAEPDPIRPTPCIRVPDRRIVDWSPSNPVGYIAWFQARAVEVQGSVRAIAPVPPQQRPSEKAILSLAVQVIKRRRDWAFREDQTNAPRSILLTTLAGMMYDGGSQPLPNVIHDILVGVDEAIIAAAPARIVVVNPTNPSESFSDCFTDISYQRFVTFIRRFRGEMEELLSVVGGIPALSSSLGRMFGEQPTNRSLIAWGERAQQRRATSSLRFDGTAGLAVTADRVAASSIVPANTFHGQ